MVQISLKTRENVHPSNIIIIIIIIVIFYIRQLLLYKPMTLNLSQICIYKYIKYHITTVSDINRLLMNLQY